MSVAGPRRRYHFHTPGVLYVLVTLFLAVGAINSQNNLLFLALGLAIGGLLVSGVISGSSLMGAGLERLPTIRAALATPTALRYRVSNRGRWLPAYGISVDEVASSGTTWAAFTAPPRAFVVGVEPRRSVIVEARIVPRRRGRMRVGDVRLWTTLPFGLTRKSSTFALPGEVLVLPPELAIREGLYRRATARAYAGAEAALTPGTGEEFYGLREYVPGDAPRSIAWRRSARTGELVVRQTASPSPRRLWVVLRLDASARPSANELAIAAASALLRRARHDGLAVGLVVPSHRLEFRPGQSPAHLRRMVEELALIEVGEPAADSDASAPRIGRGACVVVHPGEADRSLGPSHAAHVDATRIAEVFAEDDRTRAILGVILSESASSAGGARGRSGRA
ncbi:MAG: DUF58 domain-containing protein [Phycisphaerae bacterium]|nr:DUF58 domain-containing protein [Phycisphaerae bacterium]